MGVMAYDLKERTARFAEEIVELSKQIPRMSEDFHNKIHICKKEAIETKYWLRILGKAEEAFLDDCRKLWKEAHELTLIFSKIAGSSK